MLAGPWRGGLPSGETASECVSVHLCVCVRGLVTLCLCVSEPACVGVSEPVEVVCLRVCLCEIKCACSVCLCVSERFCVSVGTSECVPGVSVCVCMHVCHRW